MLAFVMEKPISALINIQIHTHVHEYAHTHIQQDLMLAFVMGTHVRLGGKSPIQCLNPFLAQSIGRLVFSENL
jgi:hypothetical protein